MTRAELIIRVKETRPGSYQVTATRRRDGVYRQEETWVDDPHVSDHVCMVYEKLDAIEREREAARAAAKDYRDTLGLVRMGEQIASVPRWLLSNMFEGFAEAGRAQVLEWIDKGRPT